MRQLHQDSEPSNRVLWSLILVVWSLLLDWLESFTWQSNIYSPFASFSYSLPFSWCTFPSSLECSASLLLLLKCVQSISLNTLDFWGLFWAVAHSIFSKKNIILVYLPKFITILHADPVIASLLGWVQWYYSVSDSYIWDSITVLGQDTPKT